MAMATKVSLQEHADRVVAPQFRQPLKTAAEVVTLHGWGDTSSPMCCGNAVSTRSMIGNPYFATCEVCGKWAAAMDGPSFSENGGAVYFLDDDKVDLDTDAVWIIGEARSADHGGA